MWVPCVCVYFRALASEFHCQQKMTSWCVRLNPLEKYYRHTHTHTQTIDFRLSASDASVPCLCAMHPIVRAHCTLWFQTTHTHPYNRIGISSQGKLFAFWDHLNSMWNIIVFCIYPQWPHDTINTWELGILAAFASCAWNYVHSFSQVAARAFMCSKRSTRKRRGNRNKFHK